MTDFKKRYGKIYSQIWKFHEKHYNCTDSDAEWESIIEEVDALYKQHPSNRFFKEMLLVVLDEIERKAMIARESERKT